MTDLERLVRIVMSENAGQKLQANKEFIQYLIPEMSACIGFDQMSVSHPYDAYTHICHVVERTFPSENVRLAALFHDVGKPFCHTGGRVNHTTFPEHPIVSADIAEKTLDLLWSKDGDEANVNIDIPIIVGMVRIHDNIFPIADETVSLLIDTIGKGEIPNFLSFRTADLLGHSADYIGRHWAREAELQEYIRKRI